MDTFNIKNSRGQTVSNVPPQTIDTTSTSLSLVGDRAAGYGPPIAENFVYLLENFASPSPPINAVMGQLWFDSVNVKLMVYDGSAWGAIKGEDDSHGTGGNGTYYFPSTGADPSQGGIAMAIHSYVSGANSSILLLFAGGILCGAISKVAIDVSKLAATVTINNVTYNLQSRFPAGLTAGMTLATDAADFIFNGHVKSADQATLMGGGTPFAGTCFASIAGVNVLLSIAGGKVVAAYSGQAVAFGNLPATITIAGQIIQIASVFTQGLGQGFTLSNGSVISGYVTLETVTSMIANETSARASAITQLYTWVDSQSATAQALTNLESIFTTATGTTTVSDAVNYILTQSSPSSALATSVSTLQAQMNNASGSALQARIANEETARANADSALATRTSTLETTAGNLTSSVTTQAGAISTLQGQNQAWLTETVNSGTGRATVSISANGVTGSSNIDLAAGSINLYNSTGASVIPVLTVTGNNVYISSSVVIGSTATSLSTVQSQASNPASVINSGSTTIAGGKITTGSITANQIATGTITAANIAAGTITSDKIAANSISASKISVSDTTNLILDPLFSDAGYWAFGTGVTAATSSTPATALSLAQFIQFPVGNGTTSQGTGAVTQRAGNYCSVEPSKPYRIAMSAYIPAGFTGVCYVNYAWYQRDGVTAIGSSINTTLNDHRTNAASSTVVELTDQIVTSPANAAYLRVSLQVAWSTTQNNAGQVYAGGLRVMRAMSGELIVDGSISASKLVAGSITANQLAANSITASKLQVGDVVNFCQDPNFADNNYWSLSNGTFNTSDSSVLATLAATSAFKTLVGNGTTSQAGARAAMASGQNFSIESGSSYRINYNWFAKAGFTGVIYIIVNWFKYDSVTPASTSQSIVQGYPDYRTTAAPADASGAVNNIVTAPIDAVYAKITLAMDWSPSLNNAGYGYLSYPIMNRATTGDLIVDGTITGDKIAANTISANSLSVANRNIQVDGIDFQVTGTNQLSWTAGKLIYVDNSNNVATQNITAGSITGPGYIYWVYGGSTFSTSTNASAPMAANCVFMATYNGGAKFSLVYGGTVIDGSRITTGSITASQLAAGVISASKLVVGDVSNYVQDPTFSDSDYWNISNGTFNTTDTAQLNILTTATAFKSAAGNGTTSQANSTAQLTSGQMFSVEANAPFRLSARWLVSNGFTGICFLQVFWLKANATTASSTPYSGVYATDFRTVAATSQTNGVLDGIVVAPSDAVFAVVNVGIGWSSTLNNAGYAYVAYPIVNHANSAVTIQDGSITGNKIAANSISASRLTVGSRNISITGIDFQAAVPGTLTWTTGTISYMNSAGSVVNVNIAAGSVTNSGCYIYWTEGATSLSYDTNSAVANADNALCICSWRGGVTFNANYGGTIIDGSRITTGTVTANQIAAGSITADNIATNAITSDKLAIYSSGQNLIANSNFENGDMSGWYIGDYSAGGNTSTIFLGSAISSGSSCLNISKPSATAGVAIFCKKIPTSPGKTYRIRLTSYFNTAITAGYYLRIYYGAATVTDNYIGQGNKLGYVDLVSNAAHIGGASIDEYTWTAPTGANWVSLSLYNWVTSTATTMALDDVQFQEQTTTLLIANGAVTANQIAANTITAAQIAAGTITATQIAAGSITGDRINSASALPATLTIGNTGFSLGTLQGVSAQAVGQNRIQFSLFENNQQFGNTSGGDYPWWAPAYNPNNISTGGQCFGFNGHQILKVNFTATAANQTVSIEQGVATDPVSGTTNIKYWSRVTPGEWIWYGGYVETSNCTVNIQITFYQSNGTTVSSTATSGTGFFSNPGFPSNANVSWEPWRKGNFFQVPSDAAFARMQFYGRTTASGTGFFSIAMPMLSGVVGGTQIAPLFNAGPTNSNPALVINTNTTLISPGKIQLTGASTLTSWLYGGDNTLINGGSIAANTITANKLTLGNRGINVIDIPFQVTNNGTTLTWGTGYVQYFDGNNNYQQVSISSGSITPGGGNYWYIYWAEGATTLGTTTSSPQGNQNQIVFCTWQAGQKFCTANYGGTIIDGSRITTGTITANQIAANSITAGQIAAGTITGNQIAANTINASKLTLTNRGFAFQDLNFQYISSSNRVQWSAGAVSYVNDAGAATSVAIASGSVGWSGSYIHIYWTQGASSLSATTNPAISIADNAVHLALWAGGSSLYVDYGGSIIDGSRITTGSISSTQILANTITADKIQDNSLTQSLVFHDASVYTGRGYASGTGDGYTDSGNGTPPYSATSPVSGGGGSGGGGGGGGGSYGGACVHIDSMLPCGITAGGADIGTPLLLLNRNDDTGYHDETVEAIRFAYEPCVRITTESGITLVASTSTPITSHNGYTVNILESLNLEVPVLDREVFRWEKIVSIEDAGQHPVALISAGNGVYAAGEHNDNRYIFTHNAQVKV